VNDVKKHLQSKSYISLGGGGLKYPLPPLKFLFTVYNPERGVDAILTFFAFFKKFFKILLKGWWPMSSPPNASIGVTSICNIHAPKTILTLKSHQP